MMNGYDDMGCMKKDMNNGGYPMQPSEKCPKCKKPMHYAMMGSMMKCGSCGYEKY